MLAHLRYAARGFARTPGLALALLLTIALGIGSNAAVLGFIRGVGVSDPPYPSLAGAVSVFERGAGNSFEPVSYDAFVALAARTDLFDAVGAARESQGSLERADGRLGMAVAAISPELARILDLPVEAGVVISDRIARTEFQSTPEIAGVPVRFEGKDTHVAGIAPASLPGLFNGRAVDVWALLDGESLGSTDRTTKTFWVFARLRSDVSLERARATLSDSTDPTAVLAVLPYTGATPEAQSGLTRILALLPAAAVAVFFIACANVAAFLLSRATSRSQETSVRVALGAGRSQLIALLAADAVLISVVGAAAGVLLAFWTAGIIPALLFQEDAEHLVFAPDTSAIVIVALVCAGITTLCGLLPLLELRHDNPAAVLRREAGGLSNAMRRVRAGLVIGQMTCCCVLTISTGMLFEGFRAALRTGSGARLDDQVLARLESRLAPTRPDVALRYFREVEKAARSHPGVATAAWTATMPGSRPRWHGLRIELPDPRRREVVLDVRSFTADTLDSMVMPPVAGRMFGGADTPGGCRAGVVNVGAATALGEDVVGRVLTDPAGDPVQIVGVVASRPVSSSSTAPIIYFYAEQTGGAFHLRGLTPFQAPVLPDRPTDAMLDGHVVSAGYFEAMGFTPSSGEIFSADREPADRCRIAVVNQQAEAMYFGGRAVGGAVIDGAGRRTTIVGVVHSPPLRTSQRAVEPSIYFPMAQDVDSHMTLMLGAREVDDAMVDGLRRTIAGVSGGTAEPIVTTLEAHLSRTALAPERIATTLMAASAVTALTLGVLGMYGAMADSVRRRRREFALRIALGAQSWRVTSQVLSEGLRLAAAGALAGLAISFVMAQALASLSPAAGMLNPWASLAGLIVLVGAVAVASVLPTRRALSADPLSIMRDN